MVSFNRSNNYGTIEGKTDGSFLDEKSSCKMVQLSFCSIGVPCVLNCRVVDRVKVSGMVLGYPLMMIKSSRR